VSGRTMIGGGRKNQSMLKVKGGRGGGGAG